MGSLARLANLLASITSGGVACGDDGSVVETPPSVAFNGSSWIVDRGTLAGEDFTPVAGWASVTETGCAPDSWTSRPGCWPC